MIKTKTYDNNLKLIVKKINGLLSVTTGIMVGAGSAYENDENNGISHFVEHMMFKGTKKRTAYEISDSIDKIGAQINAFTTKELTCYYTKSTAEHFSSSFEILSDLFLNSTFDSKEMQKEKGVILEEISMTNDTPDELCMDVLSRAFYSDKGLGKTILGTSQTVKSFTKKTIDGYLSQRYCPSNTVISIAGNISFDDAEKIVDEMFYKKFVSCNKEFAQPKDDELFTNHLFENKDIEQTHIGLAFPSIKLDDEQTNALAVANTVLGGGMSSRLFQKIREELGLAYTVYSYLSAYKTSGLMTVYAGVNPNNTKQALDAIIEVIEKFKKEGLTKDEFERGKEQIKSAFVFGQESTASQMLLYGKYMLLTGKIFSFETKIEDIAAVTMDETLSAVSNNYNIQKIASACIGRNAAPLF